MAFIDLTGKRFTRLLVLARAGSKKWLCRCDCGVEKEVHTGHLNDKTRSCGCLARELTSKRSLRHGHAIGKRTPEHGAWAAMIHRCTNPKSIRFRHYGGRGITVCERWRCDFAAFLADMGPRPSSVHSIDRIDNDAGYVAGYGPAFGPGNCRWATRVEQRRNRSDALKPLTVGGRTLTIDEWAAETGVHSRLIRRRIRDDGWSVEEALFTPAEKRDRRKAAESRARRGVSP